jgi:TolB protein
MKLPLFATLAALLCLAGVTSGDPAGASFPGANGKIVFVSDREQQPTDIYVIEGDGSNEVQLTDTPGREQGPTWSPDGSRIAFADLRDGNEDIYVMAADGSDVRRLTDDPAFDGDAAWSPDGGRIAFVTGRDPAGASIYVMDADGGDVVQLVPATSQSICCLDWSPDGRTLAYTTGIPARIMLLDMDSGGSTELQTGGPARDPSWSPDGTRIAYALSAESGSNIYTAAADASEAPRPLTAVAATDRYPAWSPDGSLVAFARNVLGGGHFDLYVVDADGGTEMQLTNTDFDEWVLDWQPLPVAGDANCDGVANSLDAAIVLQYSADLIDGLPCLEAADVNGDGRVDAIDAALVLQYDAGLLDEL